MKKVKNPRIADLVEFQKAIEPFEWIFNRFGLAQHVKDYSMRSFLKTLYQSYDADVEQLQKDMGSHAWIFKEEVLEKIMGEIKHKRDEHEAGMREKNNIDDWMPDQTWMICMNEVVLPRLHKSYLEGGLAYLVHSLIGRYPSWKRADGARQDYERLHPNQSAQNILDLFAEDKKRGEEMKKFKKEWEKQYAQYIQLRLHSTKKSSIPYLTKEEEKDPELNHKVYQERKQDLYVMDLHTMRELEELAMYGK